MKKQSVLKKNSIAGVVQSATPLAKSSYRYFASSMLMLALSACGGGSGAGAESDTNMPIPPAAAPLAPAPEAVQGTGFVELDVSQGNRVVYLYTSMVVPPHPPATGTLFLWPGLQPGGANYLPIDNGVLQPVLTWGNSCAPGNQPAAYSTWWISAQYVNTIGHEKNFTGCQGGSMMAVNVGDKLAISMYLRGTVWTQYILDVQTGQHVSYDIDLRGQAQNRSIFMIESYGLRPAVDVTFTDTYIQFANPEASACRVIRRGINDTVSAPVYYGDNYCYVKNMTLRSW
ncbi:hypothetical protein [Undibacterium sp. TS12]|uniref:hypothetical protein n=1 Tax=Undibacterium sp. TS12 TaxID=2908202 RepID=UPI001F4C61FB|nr:hypothetical protein [Undibacterium sp. TS12]MCH8620444.1 hypothetical protein [Undibacterium sp. TS12]